MANTISIISLSVAFTLMIFISTPVPTNAISSCKGPCNNENDCSGQLICINGKCNDDPDVGNRICSGSNHKPPPSSGGCKPHGTVNCRGKSYPKYSCSPPITSTTRATLNLNDFSEGGDGGAPSECDEQWHPKTERVVALSTGWYAGGSRCGRMIRINANGRSVIAKVVDECDSRNGCDSEHAGQPPCKNNIVNGSDAVWEALGLDKNRGIVDITWSLA